MELDTKLAETNRAAHRLARATVAYYDIPVSAFYSKSVSERQAVVEVSEELRAAIESYKKVLKEKYGFAETH